jgi:hypothetical protein
MLPSVKENSPVSTLTQGDDAPPPAGSTWRVYWLREQLLHTTPSLCAERGLLITAAYQKFQADPPVLRGPNRWPIFWKI